MTTDHELLAESNALEVINASAVLAEAIEKSRQSQIVAALSNESLTKEIFERIDLSISSGIKTSVNGKIDKMQKGLDDHNAQHENDMIEVRKNIADTKPIVIAFNKAQQDLATATKGGKLVLWLAATITALGGAYLILIQVIASFKH